MIWWYYIILALVNAVMAAIFASQGRWFWVCWCLAFSLYCIFLRNTPRPGAKPLDTYL